MSAQQIIRELCSRVKSSIDLLLQFVVGLVARRVYLNARQSRRLSRIAA